MKLRDRQDDFIGRILGAGEGLSTGERAYHFAYRARLTDALAETFEHVHAYLGDEAFYAAAQAHVAASRPSTWTLDAYGRDFPATLKGLYPGHPEVAEIAWLDNALNAAFTGPDSPPFDPAKLASADWERARLVLVPTLVAARLATNAAAILQALTAESAPPPAEVFDAPQGVIVWRQGFDCHYRVPPPEEFDALEAISNGATFAAVCEALPGDATAVASAWLGQWLGEALVADIV